MNVSNDTIWCYNLTMWRVAINKYVVFIWFNIIILLIIICYKVSCGTKLCYYICVTALLMKKARNVFTKKLTEISCAVGNYNQKHGQTQKNTTISKSKQLLLLAPYGTKHLVFKIHTIGTESKPTSTKKVTTVIQ